ncbi:hypothetical protein ACOME3_002832 [Neoechinorhynchus agilis]
MVVGSTKSSVQSLLFKSQRLVHTSREEIRRRMVAAKATMDFIPRPIHKWNEYMGRKRKNAYFMLAIGSICLPMSIYIFNYFDMYQGMPFKPPYHLIGNEPFPGYKFDDDTEYPTEMLADEAQDIWEEDE